MLVRSTYIWFPFTFANRFHLNGTCTIVEPSNGAIDMRESEVKHKSSLDFLRPAVNGEIGEKEKFTDFLAPSLLVYERKTLRYYYYHIDKPQ